MQVNEIFKTILGESTHSGRPCAIVRLSGCNLNCRYCDTQYHKEVAFDMSTEFIVNSVKHYNVNTALITGGEPLLQIETSSLLDALNRLRFLTLVETNGTQPIKGVPGIRIVDVKTPSSGHGDSFCTNNIKELKNNDQVKFVVSDRDDFDWSLGFVGQYLTDFRGEIMLSPNMNSIQPSKLAEWMIDADTTQIRLGVQLHKLIWGMDTRL